MPRPNAFPKDRQTAHIGPKFNRLSEVLARDPSGLALRSDPTALAPERLLVFEVRGAVGAFVTAIRKVEGLELIDEEELETDDDKAPVAYMMMPDVRALRDLEGLWRRWQQGALAHGETAWRDVFELLRNLRTWGPNDRVDGADAGFLAEEIEGTDDASLVRLEIELIYRAKQSHGDREELLVRKDVIARGGRVITRSRIDDIAYHALLVDLAVIAVRDIIARLPTGIAGMDPIRHIRPQSIATRIEVADTEKAGEAQIVEISKNPILALLDGVPVEKHPFLEQHIVMDDVFDLVPGTPVAERVHGTAMASLIVHGDRNRLEPGLRHRIHVVPVMGARDGFPNDRLVVDMIYLAVIAMRGDDAPTAPNVLIVNLSLGNRRRPFHGRLSAWARLLDRLAYRFGILFIVSAGNLPQPFEVKAFSTGITLEAASLEERATGVLRAVDNIKAERRVFSPAETVNGITVGAYNQDAIPCHQRMLGTYHSPVYPEASMSNPSSALGPGFGLSVKPDILMPGGRERLRPVGNDEFVSVEPMRATRFAGLKVAGPPRDGQENTEGYSGGTSGAAALASRTCHRIHDALEEAYGQVFAGLPHRQRAVILKALLVHPARWPEATANLIRSTIGPANNRQHVQQKDNIRRYLGYGLVDADDAIACAADRATFWATGTLEHDKIAEIDIPVPAAIGGKAQLHAIGATLAWFTPVSPGRKNYRAVRLRLLEPDWLRTLGVQAHSDQPDNNQARRGTVITRWWSGANSPAVGLSDIIKLAVQRDPDQGGPVDEPIPYGLAVTLTMPGVIEVYEQVRQRLTIPARVAA
jgi:hypothetical protein